MQFDQEQILIEFDDDTVFVPEKSIKQMKDFLRKVEENHALPEVVSITRILMDERSATDVTEEYGEMLADHFIHEVGLFDTDSATIDWLNNNTSLATNCKLERAV